MKYLLTLAIILYGAGDIKAQTYTNDDQIFYFTENVRIEGTSKDSLYERAKVILTNEYNEGVSLRMNKNSGVLIGGKYDSSTKSNSTSIHCKIVMTLRNDGYSLKLTDFKYYTKNDNIDQIHSAHPIYKSRKEKSKSFHKKIKEKAALLAENIQNDIKSKMITPIVQKDIVSNKGKISVHW